MAGVKLNTEHLLGGTSTPAQVPLQTPDIL